jgi:hypothetical protein
MRDALGERAAISYEARSTKRCWPDSLPTHPTKRACPVVNRNIFAVIAVALASSACATSRMGEADARLVNNVVCFSPSAQELLREGASELTGVWVSDVSASPAIEVWAFALKQGSTPKTLGRGECLPYGTPVADSISSGPTPLKPNTVYTVHLKSALKDSSDPTMSFMTKFCLRAGDSSETARLIQLRPGTTAWRRQVCQEN